MCKSLARPLQEAIRIRGRERVAIETQVANSGARVGHAQPHGQPAFDGTVLPACESRRAAPFHIYMRLWAPLARPIGVLGQDAAHCFDLHAWKACDGFGQILQLGIAQSLRGVNELTHFTQYVPGHAMLGLLFFSASVCIAVAQASSAAEITLGLTRPLSVSSDRGFFHFRTDS